MKDARHEHPLNDPEHQRTCARCKQMDTVGPSFGRWLVEQNVGEQVDHEVLTTFLLIFVANVAIDDAMGEDGAIGEEALRELRARFEREAAQAFDAAVLGLRSEQGA